MNKEIKKTSTGTAALLCGILSVILTFAYSVFCAVMDISGTIPRSVTAGLIFVGLIFGIIGIFSANMSYASNKSKRSISGLVLSIISVIFCVYSFILYVDLIHFTTKILNSVAPSLIK